MWGPLRAPLSPRGGGDRWQEARGAPRGATVRRDLDLDDRGLSGPRVAADHGRDAGVDGAERRDDDRARLHRAERRIADDVPIHLVEAAERLLERDDLRKP